MVRVSICVFMWFRNTEMLYDKWMIYWNLVLFVWFSVFAYLYLSGWEILRCSATIGSIRETAFLLCLYTRRDLLWKRCSLTKTYYWHIYLICGTFSLEPTSQYVYFRTILGVEMTPNTSICGDLLTKYEEIGQDPLWQCASLKKST